MTDLPRIRPATLDDVETIADIHTTARAAYYRGFVPEEELFDPAARARRRDTYADRITAAEFTVLCAELDDRVVGFALLGPPNEPTPGRHDVAQLRQIHVASGHRRQGVDSALHTACVRTWNAASITTGRVEVWENNHRARTFYARHGWRPDGHRRPGPADADYLRLSLVVPR